MSVEFYQIFAILLIRHSLTIRPFRKHALHEMKAVRREEQKQGAELMNRIRLQWDQLDEKFKHEEEEVLKPFCVLLIFGWC